MELRVGPFDYRIQLNCRLHLKDDTDPPAIRLRLTGEVLGDVISIPPRFDLGVFRDPQNRPLEFRLVSRSRKLFTVSERPDSPRFLGNPVISNSDNSNSSDVQIRVPFVISEPGSFSGMIDSDVKFENGETQKVRIPVSGFHSAESPSVPRPARIAGQLR